MGASLLTLFIDFGWNRGYVTIVIAHIAFEVSFVALTVKARLRASTGRSRTRPWTWAPPGRCSCGSRCR